MVRRLLDSVRPESVHSVVSCSFRELQLRGSSASPPPWHVPHLLESGAVAVAKAAPDGRNSMARKHAPKNVRAYLAATNNTTATAEQTRRDRWKCGEQQTPPSQTLWRWCPCRRRRRRRGRDVPQRCWRCHLIQRRNALHHLDSCGARYCLVIIEPSALQQTSPDIHAAMMLELPLPPRVAQMPSHTSPDY